MKTDPNHKTGWLAAYWISVVAVVTGLMTGSFVVCATPAEHMDGKGFMNVEKRAFGHTAQGREVFLFTLSNANGVKVKVMTYGVIITEIHTPDRRGAVTNIALGFDNLEQYLKGHPAFGATIGRVANRIAGARFTLDGKDYKLAANNGPNHIHGGPGGFDKQVWEAQILPAQSDRVAVEFSYLSRDGEEGYPGNLSVSVTMTLTSDGELRIDYRATTDKPTPINLTNHSYFNLAGAGNVLDHVLTIEADHYTPADQQLIPTGEIKSVHGTALDFTLPERVGARIDQLRPTPDGYDHNFVLNAGGKSLARAARVVEPKSGRVMEVLTTEPGVQLFTANFMDGHMKGTGGVVYPKHAGLCLETQHYPDSINKPGFPSVVLRPGQTFNSTTVFRFSTVP